MLPDAVPVHGSFQAACVARNLVADDHEWAGTAADLCRHVMNQGALHMALCTLFALLGSHGPQFEGPDASESPIRRSAST